MWCLDIVEYLLLGARATHGLDRLVQELRVHVGCTCMHRRIHLRGGTQFLPQLEKNHADVPGSVKDKRALLSKLNSCMRGCLGGCVRACVRAYVRVHVRRPVCARGCARVRACLSCKKLYNKKSSRCERNAWPAVFFRNWAPIFQRLDPPMLYDGAWSLTD